MAFIRIDPADLTITATGSLAKNFQKAWLSSDVSTAGSVIISSSDLEVVASGGKDPSELLKLLPKSRHRA